jgi:hypothetical protein
MDGITLASTASTVQINLDKKFFSAKQIKDIVSWLQIEFLAKKVNFDPSIEALGEEIHESWWQNNRSRFEDIIKESEKLQVSEVMNIKGGKGKKVSL